VKITRRQSVLLALLILLPAALVIGYGLLQERLDREKSRLVDFLRQKYGIACELGDLQYVFPDGIRTSRVAVSLEGMPFLEAQEVLVRVRPGEWLKGDHPGPGIIKSVEAAGVNVHLVRTAAGEWLAPLPPRAHRQKETASAQSPPAGPPIRCTVRDLGLDVSTPKGTLERRYDLLEAVFDPGRGTGRLSLRGGGEKVEIDLRTAPERRVEIQADSVSLQPLLLFTSPVLPFERLYLRGRTVIQERSNGQFAFTAAGSLFGRGTDASLAIHVDLEGTGTPAGLETARGTLSLGGETVEFSVAATQARRPAVQITAAFRDFSFERAVQAVPLSFRPHLPDLRVEGSLRGTFSASIATARPYRTSHRFTGEYHPLRVLALGPEIGIPGLKHPFTHTFRNEEEETVSIRVGPENPDFVPYGEIPTDLIRAVITAEDGGFFRHGGTSIMQVMESTADNVRAGRVVRGASTITMQLAKNLYLGRERTIGRKFEEFFITRALEQDLSKQRILEIYLNIIEWGDGIYGLAPAARYYFRKSPGELTEMECAFLASIIARPRDGWKPDPLANIGRGWQQYLDLIVRKMTEKEIPADPEP
jgi:hypothetical protein